MRILKKFFICFLIMLIVLSSSNFILVVKAISDLINGDAQNDINLLVDEYSETSIEDDESVTFNSIAELKVTLYDDETNIDGKENVSRDANLFYNIKFYIDNRLNWSEVEGKEFTYFLPDDYIVFPQTEADIYSDDNRVAHWKIEGNVLKFSFINENWYNINDNISGDIKINCSLKKEALIGKDEVEIQFPGTVDSVHFTLESGNVDTKKFSATFIDDEGYQCVKYTITLFNNGPVRDISLKDIFSGSLENIKLESLKLVRGFENEEKLEAESTENGFTCKIPNVETGVNYTIEYVARVSEKDFNSDSYCNLTNTVQAFWDDDQENNPVSTSTWLDKRAELKKNGQIVTEPNGLDNYYEILWTIDINNPRLTDYSVAGKTLTDVLSEENLGDFKQYYKGNIIIKGSNGWTDKCEFDSDARSFQYNFPKENIDENGKEFDPTDSFKVTYSTYIQIDNAIKGSVINEAKLNGIGFGKVSIGISKLLDGVQNFKKEFVNHDLKKHIIDWKLCVDIKDGSTIENLKVTDTLETFDEYGLLEDSIKVENADGTILKKDSDYTIEKEFNAQNGVASIIINFSKNITQDFTIYISSNYKPFEGAKEFKNKAVLVYTYDGQAGEKEAEAFTIIENKYDITKRCETYNVPPNRIKWIITVNPARKSFLKGEIQDIFVRDILPEKMVFDRESLQIFRYGATYSDKVDITDDVIIEQKDGNILFSLGKNANENHVSTGSWDDTNGYMFEIIYETSFDKDYIKDVEDYNYLGRMINNIAKLEDDEQNVYSETEAGTWANIVLLDKKALEVNANNPLLTYNINVNLQALDLVPDSDYLDLEDVISNSVSILLSSISVTDLNGNKLDNTKVSYDSSTRLLSIRVPDQTPCIVSYSTEINGEVGQTYSIQNEVVLKQNRKINSFVQGSYQKYRNSSSIKGSPGKLIIQKIDSSNIEKKISGATFELYKIPYTQEDKNDLDFENEELVCTATTDTQGTATLPSNDEIINADWLYYFVETSAPIGYEVDNTKYYIIRKGNNNDDIENLLKTKYPNIEYTMMPSDSAISINVTNSPIVKECNLVQINKKLEGKDIGEQIFTFQLKDQAGKVIQTVQSDSSGIAKFEALEYTINDIGKTYQYTIQEVSNDDKKIVFDNNYYTVDITISDGGNGELNFDTVYKKNGTDIVSEIVFNNKWIAWGYADILINKKLTGKRNKDIAEGEFQFKVVELDNTNNDDNFINYPEKGEEKKVGILQSSEKDSNGIYSSTANLRLSYNELGTHWYKIEELPNDDKNIQNDTSVFYAKVDVTDGNIVEDEIYKYLTTISYYDSNKQQIENIQFTNNYNAKGSAKIEVEKKLENRKLKIQDKEFKFGIYEVINNEEIPIKDSELKNLEAYNDSNGKIIFNLDYTQDDIGIHHYVIKELEHNSKSVSQDEKPVNVTVNVSDNNGAGNLNCDVKLEETHSFFTNIYTAKGSINLTARKELEGKKLEKGIFKFELKDQNGKVLQTVSNDENGNINFSPLEYTQDDIGNVYKYTIKEINEEKNDIIYDSSIYNIEIIVEDSEKSDGTLNITKTIKLNEKSLNEIVFKNKYEPKVELVTEIKDDNQNINVENSYEEPIISNDIKIDDSQNNIQVEKNLILDQQKEVVEGIKTGDGIIIYFILNIISTVILIIFLKRKFNN